MHTVSGVVISYHLINIIHYVMSAIGSGLITVILIILSIFVILVVSVAKQQRISLYVPHVMQK
ncbi:hypothetical protein ACFLVM_00500 [Chloroflexota bacterium]